MQFNEILSPTQPVVHEALLPTPVKRDVAVTAAVEMVKEARERLIKLMGNLDKDDRADEAVMYAENADYLLARAHRTLGKGEHTVSSPLESAMQDLANAWAVAPVWAKPELGLIRLKAMDARDKIVDFDTVDENPTHAMACGAAQGHDCACD